MFSGPEFLLIFLIMLIVLGPVRMAEVAKKLGEFIGQARRMASNLQYQLEDELEIQKIRKQLPNRVDLESSLGIDELKKDVNALKKPLLDSQGKVAEADHTDADSKASSEAEAEAVADSAAQDPADADEAPAPEKIDP